VLGDILHAVEQKIGKFVEEHQPQIDEFIDDYILELFVNVPWLDNRIRSHRLREKDIKIMSAKGLKVFDGDKGRFVKELPRTVTSRWK
jgi:hypothetical protein